MTYSEFLFYKHTILNYTKSIKLNIPINVDVKAEFSDESLVITISTNGSHRHFVIERISEYALCLNYYQTELLKRIIKNLIDRMIYHYNEYTETKKMRILEN